MFFLWCKHLQTRGLVYNHNIFNILIMTYYRMLNDIPLCALHYTAHGPARTVLRDSENSGSRTNIVSISYSSRGRYQEQDIWIQCDVQDDHLFWTGLRSQEQLSLHYQPWGHGEGGHDHGGQGGRRRQLFCVSQETPWHPYCSWTAPTIRLCWRRRRTWRPWRTRRMQRHLFHPLQEEQRE